MMMEAWWCKDSQEDVEECEATYEVSPQKEHLQNDR